MVRSLIDWLIDVENKKKTRVLEIDDGNAN